MQTRFSVITRHSSRDNRQIPGTHQTHQMSVGQETDLKRYGRGPDMRITVSHNRSKAEIIESVDRSFNEMVQGVEGLPVRLVVQQNSHD
jgi:hypothetical protein